MHTAMWKRNTLMASIGIKNASSNQVLLIKVWFGGLHHSNVCLQNLLGNGSLPIHCSILWKIPKKCKSSSSGSTSLSQNVNVKAYERTITKSLNKYGWFRTVTRRKPYASKKMAPFRFAKFHLNKPQAIWNNVLCI